MIMLGNGINALAILIGGTLGMVIGNRIGKDFERHMMQAVALGIIVLGMMGAISVRNPLLMLLALAAGALLGAWWRIEAGLEAASESIKHRLKLKSDGFSAGFVSATLLFCVGSMAIMGALNSGLYGDHSVLIAKALLDGMIGLLMASTLGVGVVFSAVPVFIYQGTIVLLSSALAPYLSERLIGDVSAVGSVLILAIGIKMLGVAQIKIGDLLPAIIVAALLSPLI